MDSSSSSLIWKHQVYPSFHGLDVRKTVVSHMLQSLKRKGIDLFTDKLCSNLIEGIRGSEMAIVILSRNYASSSCCLDELVEIMKCKEELGLLVLPVFYGVEPADVRKQSGGFGETFEKTCKRKNNRAYLGMDKSFDRCGQHTRRTFCQLISTNVRTTEADVIENIAIDVSKVLKRYTPSIDIDSDDVVGMRAHTNRNENVEADARRERTVTNLLMDVKVKPPQFQVFINYRGALRNIFVCHLVDALQRSEINVFADYQERRGEELNNLFKRIEASRIAIVLVYFG